MSDTPLRHRKPIFAAIRTILKLGVRQRGGDGRDEARDQPDFSPAGDTFSAKSDTPDILPQDRVTCGPSVPHIRRTEKPEPRTVGAAGIALIKRFEGCASLRRDGLVEAYPDPGTGGEPWTIGWGATRGGLHGRVGPGTVWTQAQCDERLEDDLLRYASDVARAIGDAPTSQAQFDALVSFHYNTGAIARATLTRRHLAGDHAGAAREFARWNKAGGRVLKGLVRRRAEEARLYRQSNDDVRAGAVPGGLPDQ